MTMAAELSVALRFLPSDVSLFRRQSISPITPIYTQIRVRQNASISESKPHPVFLAKRKSGIEGLSEELNAIASQNLDYAPARRRVRSAFVEVQQALDHCLFKIAPPGIRIEEWYEKNSKGFEIFCKQWLPATGIPIKAALCFCHGYGDTCTFFFEGVAKYIAASGYAVYALDYPGFGLSDGLHGHIQSFDEIINDVIERFSKFKEKPEVKALPHFILGQSMGGAVTLKVHLKEPQNWDGIVLVAPMCKLKLDANYLQRDNIGKAEIIHNLEGMIIAEDVTPPAAVLKMFNFISNFVPQAKLFPQKDLGDLAFRDPEKRKTAAYNVISFNHRMRVKTALELLRVTSDIEKELEKVSAPLLILHGAADKVTDPQVSRFLYEKASTKEKTFKLYEESYHSILEGEPDDRIFAILNDIVRWLDSRCS